MTVTRPDIQALRGIAVLAVLAYHAKVPFFKGGYLGVDIFFVVSGYLITGLIARSMSERSFSFSQFYWRRAWRLLPTAYVVFFVCAVASPWLLTAGEQRDFIKQLIGAVTFTGNIALWLQTGYFEQAAELKPLLHVWSLAIEEQYYLLLPIAMLWIGPRRWRVAAVVATLASAIACFVQMPSMPGAVFYLLPTRAWELGLGSVVALSAPLFEKLMSAVPRRHLVSVAALAGLCVLILVPGQTVHPGWATALACVLTAVTVANGVSWLGVRFGTSLLAWFGDRSYSLYLVHWPLLAFLYSANVASRSLPWTLRLLAVLTAIVLAALLYRWVETPLRVVGRRPPKVSQLAAILLASVVIVALGLLPSSLRYQHEQDYATRFRANKGLDPACDQYDSFAPSARCRLSGDSPRVLLWGDSYAMHWAAGLSDTRLALIQATRSSCPPVPGIALYAPPMFSESFVIACRGFNADVLRYLKEGKADFDVVALASQWSYFIGANTLRDGEYVETISRELVSQQLTGLLREIADMGKRAVLFVPPPSVGFDMGRCVERRRSKLVSFGATPDCSFSLADYRAKSEPLRSLLTEVAVVTGATVIDAESVLCDAKSDRCSPELGEVIVYRDAGHLTYEGSVELARRMQLRNRLHREPR